MSVKRKDKQFLITKFIKTVENLQIDLKNDSSWPVIAQELLKNTTEDDQFSFWLAVEKYFKEQENHIGHCHKGHIYWKLSLFHLQKGDITKCSELLEYSAEEDRLRNPYISSASIGMLSVIKPLLITSDTGGKSWIPNQDMNDFYSSLNLQEKGDFAKDFFELHDMTASGIIWVIEDNFFKFIDDPKKRQVTFDIYKEVSDIVKNTNLSSYYSCIFSLGSILEGMLDDFFERNNQKEWKIFYENKDIQNKAEKLHKGGFPITYDRGATLGRKMSLLLLMAKHNVLSMPRHLILQMEIIHEYRNLIHPQRSLGSPYKPDWYVASFLFNTISKFIQVVGDKKK